jgi:hypothetical protein
VANSDDHLQLVKDTMSPGSAERPIFFGPLRLLSGTTVAAGGADKHSNRG